jgi:hypothetical protein
MATTATVDLGFRGIDHKVGPVQVIHPLREELGHRELCVRRSEDHQRSRWLTRTPASCGPCWPAKEWVDASFSNPFAALLDPAGILSACAQAGALDALPVSARRSADRVSPNFAGELAEHDAAVDEIYRQLIAKASKTLPSKSKKTAPAQGA